MQFSTDLPYGEKEVQKHLESKQTLPMNVSKSADQTFMSELKRTDPRRYDRLEKAIRVSALRQETSEPRCQHCNLILPIDIRKDARYCDSACKKAYQRSKAA